MAATSSAAAKTSSGHPATPGLDSTDAIANIARNGIGQMSGYGDQLGEGGDELVAAWILEQAQNAWIQG